MCNSKNTQQRVKTYLGREAEVVYPPTETVKFHYQSNGNYWLSVNRIISHKRIDMQIAAFKKLPHERLIIVGSYEKSNHFQSHAAYIKSICPENVKILSWVSQEELIVLYANCKGFITTANDEDFGMTPVEAMASGKPVIAPNEGGYKETITDGHTGILIDNIDADKLIEAIDKIGRHPEKYKDACQKRAKFFDEKVFIEKIKRALI